MMPMNCAQLTNENNFIIIGYGKESLTVNPPLTDREWAHFYFYGCLAPLKIFRQRKLDFIRVICFGIPENVVI